jgi:predicted RNase H-like HicB family nuclease
LQKRADIGLEEHSQEPSRNRPGRTKEEALTNISEAISLHLEVIEDELRGKKLIEVDV